MTLRLWTAPVVALLLLGLARPAHAQPPTADKAPPPTRLEACIAAFEDGQRRERSGDLREARKHYENCGTDACPKELREDCVRGLGALDRALPTATFLVRDASGKDIPATFKVDGQPISAEPGRATSLDPGEHIVEATTATGQTFTSKVVIHEGEKSRIVVLSPPPDEATATRGSRPTRTGPIILGAGGGLAFLAGVGFLIRYALLNAEQDKTLDEFIAATTALQSQPGGGVPGSPAFERRQRLGQEYNEREGQLAAPLIAGVALTSVGLLAGGGALAWYLTGKPSTKTSVRVTPTAGGLVLGGSF